MSEEQEYMDKAINACVNARADVIAARERIANESRSGIASPDFASLQKAIFREDRAMTDLDVAIELMAMAQSKNRRPRT